MDTANRRWSQHEALIRAVRLALKAYHCEEEPGQFTSAALQLLRARLQDWDTETLTGRERYQLNARERQLRQAIDENYLLVNGEEPTP